MNDSFTKVLDGTFDLIDRKIPDHHLKAKFVVDVKQAIMTAHEEAVREARIDEVKRAMGTPKDGQMGYAQLEERLATLSEPKNKETGDE